MSLITIDFHNTLFHCDEWFQLEIETLPVAFLQWRQEQGATPASGQLEQAALAAYAKIRRQVTSSGQESDAVSSLKLVCRELELPVSDVDVEEGISRIMQRALPSARPLDGAASLVEALVDDGYTLAVVSSAAYHPFLEWALERYGLRQAFSAIITSASCGIYKSNPDIYRHTLAQLNTSSTRAVHIGDSHRFDVTSARAAGMRTVLLSRSYDPALVPQPDAWVASLGEVPAVLDTLPVRRQSV